MQLRSILAVAKKLPKCGSGIAVHLVDLNKLHATFHFTNSTLARTGKQ
jgi:hypothetical protein